jgi:kynurenine formamidase
MTIIDLTLELENWKVWYPWDPATQIKNIETIENDWWNLKQLKISSHDWTHVNVPIHSKIKWKNLDNYLLNSFIWKAILFNNIWDIKKWVWLIFNTVNIDFDIAKKIVEIKPSFIWLPSEFEFNTEIEKYLLKNDIISYERLTNTDKLPKNFIFHWVPLKIKNGDGSPVRAYAII